MRRSDVVAVVVASVFSVAAGVGAQAPAPTPDAHVMNRGAHRLDERGEREGRNGLVRGLSLSATEKARVKEIRESYAGQRRALRDALAPALAEVRSARQRGDTAAARAAFERTRSQREQVRALQERELGDLRGALSPENQKLFDARRARFQQRRAERGDRGEERWERVKHRKHDRHEKHEKQGG